MIAHACRNVMHKAYLDDITSVRLSTGGRGVALVLMHRLELVTMIDNSHYYHNITSSVVNLLKQSDIR